LETLPAAYKKNESTGNIHKIFGNQNLNCYSKTTLFMAVLSEGWRYKGAHILEDSAASI
jgi:hypothetical protein